MPGDLVDRQPGKETLDIRVPASFSAASSIRTGRSALGRRWIATGHDAVFRVGNLVRRLSAARP